MEYGIDVNKVKEAVKRGPGQPTKYDPDVHLDMLIDLFNQGKSIVEFCATACITKPTFYSWLSNNPEFKYAFKLALQLAQVHWEHYPIDCEEEGKAYNFQHYFLLMKNRFGFSQIKKPKDDAVSSKLKTVWKSFTSGKITASEFNAAVSGITGELRCTELELKSRELDIRVQENERAKREEEWNATNKLSKYSDNQLREHFNLMQAVEAGKEFKVTILEPSEVAAIEQQPIVSQNQDESIKSVD